MWHMTAAMCNAEGCTTISQRRRGLCPKHYEQAYRAGTLPPPPKPRHVLRDVDYDSRTATCEICGPTHINVEFNPKRGKRTRRCPGERKKRNSQTSEARRATHLRRQYGITQAEYDAMADAQDGKCAICGVEKPMLHVDHDHKTQLVRGLLCGPCNRGIGLFWDNPKLLSAAARYLRR